MSDAPAKNESVQELVQSLPRRIFQRDALLLVVALACGAAAYGYAQQQRKEGTAEDIAPVMKRVEAIEDAGRRHANESAEIHAELKKDMAELARDVRELYRVVRDPSRRSERLEQPVVSDGGAQ